MDLSNSTKVYALCLILVSLGVSGYSPTPIPPEVHDYALVSAEADTSEFCFNYCYWYDSGGNGNHTYKYIAGGWGAWKGGDVHVNPYYSTCEAHGHTEDCTPGGPQDDDQLVQLIKNLKPADLFTLEDEGGTIVFNRRRLAVQILDCDGNHVIGNIPLTDAQRRSTLFR